MKARAFAAVRLTEGREWVDIGTVSRSVEQSRHMAAQEDNRMGHNLAYQNPVVRVVAVTIEEE